jgi:NAD(P)-dependent dehydrogenase (short-subunit alcohol dehydrogenase family)
VRIDDDIHQAVNKTVQVFGRIDILFNNAGICAYGLAHELTESEWDNMVDINLKGAWLVGPPRNTGHDSAKVGGNHQ